MSATAYRDFLEAKVCLDEPSGFACAADEVNPYLKPHARDMVLWAVRGGRRGLFASFGLHKTVTQLEVVRLTLLKCGGGRGLIVAPLGVRGEFFRDAKTLGTPLTFIRSHREAKADGMYLTNYESVREGKLDPTGFQVVSLDEASVLRGFGGTKTFREFMRLFEGTSTYRFVATATPSPNEYIELLAYAAFLGVMDVGQAKTRFFKRDSEHADQLTLHSHKEREFWLWVASWALFVSKPSDLGHSDEGYELPPLEVVWHEVPTDHAAAGAEKDGQGRLLRNSALGVVDASREKRDSLPTRIAKLMELRAAEPDEHRLIWHDLEAERRAIEAAVPGVVSVYGTQDLEEREAAIVAFSDGQIRELAAKPVIAGSGCNFQRHCARAVFLGIGFKFNDFIQAVHRIQRFQQKRQVRVDMIYTEAEREVKASLERKWKQHDVQVAQMTAIVREYGLATAALGGALTRTLGVTRRETSGPGWVVAHNDCVEETARIPADSLGLVLTSVPFATQYEYSPSYNDFGHTDDNAHFFRQMDFLTPELLRALKPGRLLAVHVKDRITPSGLTGMGFQTVSPFHADCITHYSRHGFGFLGMKTIVTDVVRENAQTYRLGWTEQCKDGSRMGVGMSEYLLLFRKPPTDRSRGYADEPVIKDKAAYTRARWQFDAHGFMRSSGNRLLLPEDLAGLTSDQVFKCFRAHSLGNVYDFEHDVALAEQLDRAKMLPPGFMLLQPQSHSAEVWTDVTRMRTLNGEQAAKGREMHLCPLQFDIVDRAIAQYTNPGDEVYDPFGGLFTVPLRAVKMGRRGRAAELNGAYYADGVWHLEAQDRKAASPMLFDLGVAEDLKTQEPIQQGQKPQPKKAAERPSSRSGNRRVRGAGVSVHTPASSPDTMPAPDPLEPA